MHETSLVPVLMYGSETKLWKQKERSRIRVIQMDNLRGLLGIRMVDRVPNAQTRKLYGVMKGLMRLFSWSGHVERMEKKRITKRVC